MIILLSPAKTFHKERFPYQSEPLFNEKTDLLLSKLKKLSQNKLKQKMKLSDPLAETVYAYYQNFGQEKSAAIYTYHGHAFKHLDPNSLTDEAASYMRHHLLIISGLYGLVKPFDGISKYRLEMKDQSIFNLYTFWKKTINDYLKQIDTKMIVNLTSSEYGLILNKLPNLYHIDFYQQIDGKLKSISMEVKKMRGLMARYLLLNPILKIQELKSITIEDYIYDEKMSDAHHYIFTKKV